MPARELLMLELGLERPEKRVRLDLVEVRIALADLEPEIWRSVLLPVTNDLHDLNLAILGCMGWTGFREPRWRHGTPPSISLRPWRQVGAHHHLRAGGSVVVHGLA